jgi:hypothetical protein
MWLLLRCQLGIRCDPRADSITRRNEDTHPDAIARGDEGTHPDAISRGDETIFSNSSQHSGPRFTSITAR